MRWFKEIQQFEVASEQMAIDAFKKNPTYHLAVLGVIVVAIPLGVVVALKLL